MTHEDGSGPAEGTANDTRTVRPEDRARAAERRIGPYRLLRELGHGGMGTVFLAARADEQFHKKVALKVIRGGADSEEVVRHFKRERQILAGLDHPNIARLLDGGTTDDGLPYLVMEYIEGEPLVDYCDSRRLNVTERLRLFQSICAAVQFAHRNLVVHRDIKPNNILVDTEGSPRLLDFGIAKLLNRDLAGEAATATSFGMTPEYASPEQIRGGHITTATDVYSLGVVLYELLTGRHPYRLATRQPLEVLKAISEQEPEKPSDAARRTEDARTPGGGGGKSAEAMASMREGTAERLRRRLRGDLDNILMTALRKEPQRRYASVEAFSEDVRRYLEGLPVKARQPTAAYRAAKFVRRHRAGVLAAIALVAMVIGFAVSMAVQSERVARERDLAEKERAAAQRERATAQRVSTFLVDLFRVSDPGEARGNSITAREVLDTGSAKITGELKDQPDVRAALMDTMGRVYTNLGLYDRAAPLLHEALATRKAVFGDAHLDVAESKTSVANLLYEKGDYLAPEALHLEALAVRRKLLGNEHVDVAKSLLHLGNVLMLRGEYAGAEAHYRDALAIQRRLLGNEHVDTARTLHNLANLVAMRAEYDSAERLYRESLDMERKLLGKEHPSLVRGLNNLGMVLAAKRDNAAAEAIHREALDLGARTLGSEHPDVLMSLDALATLHAERGDHAGAEKMSRQALASWRKVLGDAHPDVGMSQAGLAEKLMERNLPEALRLARGSVAILQRALPADHQYVADAKSILGECLVRSGRPADAEPLLLESLAVLEPATGKESRGTQKAIERLAQLYEKWGKPAQAATYRARLAPGGGDPKAASR
jgi:serine/threonine-protein kinase